MAESQKLSSKENKKKEFLLEEKQGFEKLYTDVKESIFQVLYLILKDEDDSLLVFIFSAGADFMQNLAFTFYPQILSIWKATSILNTMTNFFNFFQLQTYFGSAFVYSDFVISFYLTVAGIVLVFINVIYVSYAFSKKRVSAIWPVIILRSITSLVFTLLFLPLTQLLVAMFQCRTDSNGKYVLYYYSTVECFKGAHVIHATIAIVTTALFSVVGLVVSLTYFEVRMTTESSAARQHSRGDVFFTINKILLQLSFAFFTDQWILVLTLLLPAIVLWYIYNVDEPYYNKYCTVAFRIFTTYYLWSNVMACVSKLLENTSFTGGLITWVIGLPFIGAIMMTSSRSKVSSLVKTSSRFKTSEDLLEHLRFVLQLIDTFQTDKNAAILLTGYIEKHKDTCEEDDCPLRMIKKRKLGTGTKELDEMILGLILVVDRMYEAGIKKFKASAKLRIAYCVFLIERKKNTKKAEQEFAKAKEMNLGFVDEFTIFRLTKLINDGFEGVDVVGLIAWENYKKLYIDYIRQSADLHKEFWFELKDDRPNLVKLNFLGAKINTALTYAQDYWARLQKIRDDDPIILRTYGKFLVDIQNDIVEGMDIMQKAKKLMAKKVNYHINLKNNFGSDTREHPYVEVVGNGSEIGTIKSANLLFTILVGVGREEILNKKINNFMPELFAQYHDTFLKNYNSREEDEADSGYLDNDNELFIKSKSGYIIPVLLRVSRIKTEEASNQLVFGAWLKNEHIQRHLVYFICKPDGTITDMTASAVTILNLNLQQVKKVRMTIDKIAPGALSFSKDKPQEVSYKIDDNHSSVVTLIVTTLPIQLRDENNSDFKDAYQTQNPGKPPLSANHGIYGYIVKMEKIEEKKSAGTELAKFYSKNIVSQRRPSHMLNMLETDQSFKTAAKSDREDAKEHNPMADGQIIYGFETEKIDLEINELFQNDGIELDFENLMKGNVEKQREHRDYGLGISHKKHFGGRLMEVNDDVKETEMVRLKQWEEDAEEEESLFRKEDEDLMALDSKKRKDKLSALKRLVKDALETNSRSTTIARLKSLTCLWVISIVTIGILQFYFLQSLFKTYQTNLHILNTYSDQISEISQINSVLIDFLTFNAEPSLLVSYQDANVTTRRDDLKVSVGNLMRLDGEFNQDEYVKYLTSFTEPMIDITVYTASDPQMIQKSLSEAIVFVTAKTFALHTADLSEFTLDNPQVQTVMFNFINVILPAIRTTFSTLSSNMDNSLKEVKVLFVVLFALNVLLALLTSYGGVRSLNDIQQQKSDVLLLFLEIPPKNVEIIGKKRDKFIEFFEAVSKKDPNNQEADESIEEDVSIEEVKNQGDFNPLLDGEALGTENLNEEQEEALKNRKKLIKKYRLTNFQRAKDNLIRIIILVSFSVIYSVVNMTQLYVTRANIQQYIDQFFVNNLLSDTVLAAVNFNRLLTLTPYLVVNGIDIKDAAYDSLTELDSLLDGLQTFFLHVTETTSSLKAPAKRFYNQNACLDLTDQTDIDACETGLNQALKLGFLNLKDEIFKLVSEQYDLRQAGSDATDQDYITFFEIADYYNAYGDTVVGYFNGVEEDYLKNILSSASNIQEIILIVYLLLIILLGAYFWFAFIIKLSVEIWKTTRMITMIPLDVVNNIPSIKRFLKNVIRKSAE